MDDTQDERILRIARLTHPEAWRFYDRLISAFTTTSLDAQDAWCLAILAKSGITTSAAAHVWATEGRVGTHGMMSVHHQDIQHSLALAQRILTAVQC